MTRYVLIAVYNTDVFCAYVWKVIVMNIDVHWHLIVPAISPLAPFSVLIQDCIIHPVADKAHKVQDILAVVTLVTDVLSKAINSPCFFFIKKDVP